MNKRRKEGCWTNEGRTVIEQKKKDIVKQKKERMLSNKRRKDS